MKSTTCNAFFAMQKALSHDEKFCGIAATANPTMWNVISSKWKPCHDRASWRGLCFGFDGGRTA
jgi:hypothetical protein